MISNSSGKTPSCPNRCRRLSRGSGAFGLFAVLLLWGLPLCAAAQDASESANATALENTWYGMTISQNVTGFVVTHFWSKGPSMRAEVVVAGRRIVTIVTPTLYYTLDLTRGTGLGIARSDLAKAADATRARPFGDEYAAILRGGGEFVAQPGVEGERGARDDERRGGEDETEHRAEKHVVAHLRQQSRA